MSSHFENSQTADKMDKSFDRPFSKGRGFSRQSLESSSAEDEISPVRPKSGPQTAHPLLPDIYVLYNLTNPALRHRVCQQTGGCILTDTTPIPPFFLFSPRPKQMFAFLLTNHRCGIIL